MSLWESEGRRIRSSGRLFVSSLESTGALLGMSSLLEQQDVVELSINVDNN